MAMRHNVTNKSLAERHPCLSLCPHSISRDHFVYAPSQWETMLQCNVVSHWLGTFTKCPHSISRDHFVHASSQWETTLRCNVVSHWLGAFTICPHSISHPSAPSTWPKCRLAATKTNNQYSRVIRILNKSMQRHGTSITPAVCLGSARLESTADRGNASDWWNSMHHSSVRC